MNFFVFDQKISSSWAIFRVTHFEICVVYVRKKSVPFIFFELCDISSYAEFTVGSKIHVAACSYMYTLKSKGGVQKKIIR